GDVGEGPHLRLGGDTLRRVGGGNGDAGRHPTVNRVDHPAAGSDRRAARVERRGVDELTLVAWRGDVVADHHWPHGQAVELAVVTVGPPHHDVARQAFVHLVVAEPV